MARNNTGAAHWVRSAPLRYRFVNAQGETTSVRYADTLTDIREDFEGEEDAVEARVEKRGRYDIWSRYARIVWGENGLRTIRGGWKEAT